MRKRVLAISGLTLAAVVLAACGGGGPAVPSVAIPSVAIPSLSLPSLDVQPDAALEELFPDTVGGQPLDVTSATGEGVITAFGSSNPEELRSLITNLGADISQASAAISFNIWPGATAGEFSGLTLVALRVQGVEATRTLASLTEITKEDVTNAQVGTATIGGKQVTAITSPDEPDENVYLHAWNDVVFLGGGTPSLIEEAFAQLP